MDPSGSRGARVGVAVGVVVAGVSVGADVGCSVVGTVVGSGVSGIDIPPRTTVGSSVGALLVGWMVGLADGAAFTAALGNEVAILLEAVMLSSAVGSSEGLVLGVVVGKLDGLLSIVGGMDVMVLLGAEDGLEASLAAVAV